MDKKVEKSLGREIAIKRRELGISQEELGFRCGLHRTYISQVERGTKSITIGKLMQIANALDVSASDLLMKVEKSL